MRAKVILFAGGVLALLFLVLSLVALDVVPKYIDDKYYVLGMEGKWSSMVSLLCYSIAAFCGFFVWMAYRAVKLRENNVLK